MIYYKVKKDSYVYRSNRQRYALFENELLTLKEMDRLNIAINPQLFEMIEIPKSKIYWCFGARWQDE